MADSIANHYEDVYPTHPLVSSNAIIKPRAADLMSLAYFRAEPDTMPTKVFAASTTDDTAVMFNAPYYTEKDRGQIPEYINQFNVASWEPWLTFDGIASAGGLDNTPVLIVHSESAAIPHGVKAFANKLTGEKNELWLEDISQFDFYDNDKAVSTASDTVAKHFV